MWNPAEIIANLCRDEVVPHTAEARKSCNLHVFARSSTPLSKILFVCGSPFPVLQLLRLALSGRFDWSFLPDGPPADDMHGRRSGFADL